MATRTRDDSRPYQVPWTAPLALRAAGATAGSRAEQVAAVRDAIDDERLPREAVDALIAAGWKELRR